MRWTAFVAVVGAVSPGCCMAVSTFEPGTRQINLTEVGPANVLPAFSWLGSGGECIDKMAPQKTMAEQHGTMVDGLELSNPDWMLVDGLTIHSHFLPYRIFDHYRSERIPTSVPTLDLVDGDLRARITPQWGGKVFALEHVPSGRDLLHSPAVHQPVVAAVRNAQV